MRNPIGPPIAFRPSHGKADGAAFNFRYGRCHHCR